MIPTNLELISQFDYHLKYSPFGYRVKGMEWDIRSHDSQQARSYSLEELSLQELSEQFPPTLDDLRAVADELEALNAGRAIYRMIESLFRHQPEVPSVAEGLMVSAFGTEEEKFSFNSAHLTHPLGTCVVWLGLNALPWRITGMFEDVPVQLEIGTTKANLSEERWGSLEQVKYHGAKPESEEQPSHSFKLRLASYLWQQAAQIGIVEPKGIYSPPPWHTDPIYQADPPQRRVNFKPTRPERQVVQIRYERERLIRVRLDGTCTHSACTASQFRAYSPQHQVVKPEGIAPAPVPLGLVREAIATCRQLGKDQFEWQSNQAYREAISICWRFNNGVSRHPALHHLWRQHDEEVRLAEQNLSRVLQVLGQAAHLLPQSLQLEGMGSYEIKGSWEESVIDADIEAVVRQVEKQPGRIRSDEGR